MSLIGHLYRLNEPLMKNASIMTLRNYGLSIFFVLLTHTYIGECSEEKRLLLEDNSNTVDSKLNNLTKEVETLKKEMGESSLY